MVKSSLALCLVSKYKPKYFIRKLHLHQNKDLYLRLYTALGVPIPFKQFVPHVTVAKEISPHRLVIVKEQIASYLARERFFAGSIDLLTPLAGGKWVSVRTFPLKGLTENPLAML